MSEPGKLILAVIDGMKPSMLERAVATGVAPTLQAVMQRGAYVDDCVAAFPSVTPTCAASIATGVGPDEHHIPSMNWYSREEGRFVEYGSSFAAARKFGLTRQLTDTVYNMNGVHLSRDVRTVFEVLDDADVRTAGTTYLMYRGRHEHHVDRSTLLGRTASALFRHPVLGPRELFYADVFASRKTKCRSQLAMPGQRDRHAGCVGEFLFEGDLCDFLLLSLPDNDTYSHKHGPHAQVESIAEADRQIARVLEPLGGVDAYLDDHAIIAMADHSHTLVQRAIDLTAALEGFAQLGAAGREAPGADEAEVAVCRAQRSAGLYVLEPRGRDALVPRLVRAALDTEGVDLAVWRDGLEGVIAGQAGELRFRVGGGASDVRDRRGGAWTVSGELAVLDASVEDGVLQAPAYPDALGRVWSALLCPTGGDVLLSAAPGYEFLDWGGVAHVGGGSHGSLHATDSLGALLWAGASLPADRTGHDQWALRDVAEMVSAHFGLS